MSFRSMFYAVAVFLGSGLSAQAVPLYNSFNSVSTTVAVGTGTYADSFTTGSSGVVNDIAIALTKTSSSSGSVVITLWTDNGSGLSVPGSDAPGTQIATLGTVTASSLTLNAKTIEFYTPSVEMAANTEYWVEISKAAGPTSTINFYLNASAPTLGGTSGGNPELYRANGVNATLPPEMEICVSGDGSCTATLAAPEPPALSLLGLGIAGLGFAVHRRRRFAPPANLAS
ncbi:MAG: PEP-CTERM sorting domain-containing protein [Acetobacteraceae bacterium]|nr:PEP-CTERM sorting domain-containing protein [Acetobacteraceae bacterium]